MRILLVEDDPVLGDVMWRSLSQRGHRVDTARSLEEAILWHGGEAEAAQAEFVALSADERDALIVFLEDL